ncbi:MAG: hypothetical protein ACWGMT_08415 [Burkholderiales bacterium]
MALTRSQSAQLEKRLAELSKEVQENIRKTMPKPADERSMDRAGAALDSGDEAANNVQEEFDHALHERYLTEFRQLAGTSPTNTLRPAANQCPLAFKGTHHSVIASHCGF